MKIEFSLSDSDIQSAIRKLKSYEKSFERNTQRLVQVLAEEGGNICAEAYGSMAQVDVVHQGKESVIIGNGEAVSFAQFGAGDATISEYPFQGKPDYPVESGSFSRSEFGSGMYDEYGYWKFGGRIYHEVRPRQGMMLAENHIEQTYESKATEVFGHD